ncbi:MAG: cation:dicarboxylase symporter family transporter [Candidatus Sulfotelmatobacter sp.]|jgi:aerobic C4-dicarboxylate transport protein
MSTPTITSQTDAAPSALPRRKPFYASLWVQVLIAMVAALVLGYFSPARAIAMKPLGDAFIRMITMIITILIPHFLHGGDRHRWHAGLEEGRPRRGQGSALL